MIKNKRTVRRVASKLGLDPDELLVTLWYFIDRSKFAYLKKIDTAIRKKDLSLVDKIVYLKKILPDKNINSWMNFFGYKNKKQFLNFLEKEFKVLLDGNINEISEDLSQELFNFLDKQTSKKDNNPAKEKLEENINLSFSESGNLPSAELLFLNKDDVLIIHSVLVKDFENLNDPIYPTGIKDEQMLESAIFHPHTSYAGVLKYPTIESAASAIMYSICQNHCFYNGNKRTALVSMLVFLNRHNISIYCNEDDLFKMALSLADHKLDIDNVNSDSEIHSIYKWICERSKYLTKGERIIKFKRLNQILNRFGCSVDGNKVERIVVRESKIFGKRKKTLKTTIRAVQLGHDVDIELIKKIRKDLELDCDHNIDLDSFYYDAEFYACEFVEKYKNLLRRLSKF